MARLEAVAERFRIVREATLEATQRVLVKTAKREHERIMATDPQPASFKRRVDGIEGASEEAVKPNGVIVYRYPRLEQVVQYAMEVLFDLSPVLSGEYRQAHTIFVNGMAVPNLKGTPAGTEVVISNPMPYARKIEVGSMTMRAPGSDQVYQQARRRVMLRYSNLASIQFTYRDVASGRRSGPKPGRETVKARDLRYPALIIKER